MLDSVMTKSMGGAVLKASPVHELDGGSERGESDPTP